MSAPSGGYYGIDFKKQVYTTLSEIVYSTHGVKISSDKIDKANGFPDLVKHYQMSTNEANRILDITILKSIITVMQTYAENSAPKKLSYMSMFDLQRRAHNQHGILAEQIAHTCKKALFLLQKQKPHQKLIEEVVALLESVSKQHCHEQDDFPDIVDVIATTTCMLKNWNFKNKEKYTQDASKL